MTLIDAVLIINGLLTIFLIFLVFSRNPNNIINQSFSIFLISAAIWPFAIALFRISQNLASLRFWDILIYIAAILVPASFVFFSYSFTQRKTPPWHYSIICSLTPLALLPLLFTNLWIKNITIVGSEKIVDLGPAYVAWMAYYFIFMTWGAFLYLLKFRQSSGIIKAQMRLVLIALLFPIMGAVVPNIIMPLFGNYNHIYFGPIFLTLMNVIITYTIVKHRLFDIRLVVARTASYSLLILTLAASYAAALFGISSLFHPGSLNSFPITINTLLALILAFTFQPLRRFFEKATTRVFYKDRYDTEELLGTMSEIMTATLDLRALATNITYTLRARMHISKAALAVRDGSKLEMQGVNKDAFNLSSADLNLLEKHYKLLVFEELPEDKLKQLLRRNDISVCLPLKTKGHKLGLLILGSKSSGDIYFSQDLRVLEILGPEIAVALQNAMAYQEIQEFSRTLEKKVEERTKQLKATQKRELAKAQELLKLKDEFVFIATHDLAEPVTAIQGYLDLIEPASNQFPPDVQENFLAVRESSSRLKDLLDDLLQVARSESGTIKIEVSPVNITQIIQASLKQANPSANKKQISLKSDLNQPNIFVLADEEKLSEIMENLLSNAIKFNHQGGSVQVTAKRVANNLQVSVSDTGYGIPKNQHHKIFQKFFKHRGAKTQGIPGTGLGLFVVRMLLEKMGGSISFTSQENKGTTFTFTLPLAKTPPKPVKS